MFEDEESFFDRFFAGGRFFNDDGTEIDPDQVPKPDLCKTCKKDGARGEDYVLCILNRVDQQDEPEFKCYDYVPKRQ